MAKSKTDHPLHLIRLEVSDFKRISCLVIDAAGKHVSITGANGVGKTSAIEAFVRALQGTSSKDVPEPVRRGASKATTVVDLGDVRVTRTDSNGRSVLTVCDALGVPLKGRPQDVLDTLVGHMLNPADFVERMSEREQLAEILAVADVKPPFKEVETITGEKSPDKPMGISALEYLESLCGKTGIYYVRRTEANRIAAKKLAAAQEAMADLPGEAEEPTEDITALLARMDALEKAQAKRDALAKEEALKQSAYNTLNATGAQMQKRLKALKDEVAKLEAEVKKNDAKVAKAIEELTEAQEKTEAFPDPMPELKDVRAEIRAVESRREATAAAREKKANFERLKAEAREAEEAAAKADKIVKELDALKAKILSREAIGIDGLEVKEDRTLLYKGVPFRQASTAEQYAFAIALAMRRPRRIRMIAMDGWERLTDETRAIVYKMAEENDYRILSTGVVSDYDDKYLHVEIVEGGHE